MASRQGQAFTLRFWITGYRLLFLMLSAKLEYACVALARLALEHASGRPLQVRKIAEQESIPEGFLVQILQELKRLGLVTSTRGAAGGYRLAQDPHELSLGEALDLLAGLPTQSSSIDTPSPLGEAISSLVHESAEAARERLRSIPLAQIAARAAEPAAMYYI